MELPSGKKRTAPRCSPSCSVSAASSFSARSSPSLPVARLAADLEGPRLHVEDKGDVTAIADRQLPGQAQARHDATGGCLELDPRHRDGKQGRGNGQDERGDSQNNYQLQQGETGSLVR